MEVYFYFNIKIPTLFFFSFSFANFIGLRSHMHYMACPQIFHEFQYKYYTYLFVSQNYFIIVRLFKKKTKISG